MLKIKEQIINFIKGNFNVSPEYPWESTPEFAVFRNQTNKKWFAIFMLVPKDRLKLPGTELIPIINLKCNPQDGVILRNVKGVFPAYHMNKEKWITLLLDGTLPQGMIFDLISESYSIIDKKTKRVK